VALGIFFWTSRINPHAHGGVLHHAARFVHQFNGLKWRHIGDIFVAGAFCARGGGGNDRETNGRKYSHYLIVTAFGPRGNCENRISVAAAFCHL
jgi:hypothetical protein